MLVRKKGIVRIINLDVKYPTWCPFFGRTVKPIMPLP